MTPAPGGPPALPDPNHPLPSPPRVPPRLQPVPGAGLLTGANAWGCFASLPPGAGSLPACVCPVPSLNAASRSHRRLLRPPRRAALPPEPGARGAPGSCRPPPSRSSRPTAPPAAKHTDLPPHPGFPRLFKGSRWPGEGGGGFPSAHLPAEAARVIAHLNKAATQVRANCGQPGRARASRCRTTNPGRGGDGGRTGGGGGEKQTKRGAALGPGHAAGRGRPTPPTSSRWSGGTS